MRRYLIIALVVAFSVLSPVTNGNSAEQNPKFTLIFERAKAISCSKDQSNILIDFTNYYTANYHRQIDSNIQCQFSISPSTQNFAVSKDNGLLRVHPQIFENNTWIRAAKSQLNIGGAEAWGYPLYEKRKAGKDGRLRLDSAIRFPYVNPPISDEYKAKGYSHFFGLKAGSFCIEQTPGPLKFRYEIVNGKTSYFSNAVSISYVNYDKILYNGYNCYSTTEIVKPETSGSAQNSQLATPIPKTEKSVLKPCTTNEKLVLTQIDRQKYPLLQRQNDLQLELQKLQYDYGVAYLTGGQDRIQIEISRVESDLSSIGRSVDSLSSQRQKILAKCNPNAQPSSNGVKNLKKCSQTEISRMQSLQKQYRALMRQADLYTSEIALLENRIGYLMLQGKMEEIAAANFAIEDQMQYRDQASAQASFVKKQFEIANSACLNSGITL